MTLAYLPSPERGVWHIGPVPLRAYALCILLGVVVAVVMGERRWAARGGRRGTVTDVATCVVPLGLVGARIYHVITSPGPYLEDPVRALYVWQGGLGIPGGVAGGVLAGYVICRRRGIAPGAFADAVAPGVALAQAVGRFGNWFNQELFGLPTTLPWALEIDPQHRPAAYADAATFHPTFLYEAVWNVGVAAVVVWADRRFRLSSGRAFALYLALYAVGRAWIEALRVDPAAVILGLRLNDWVMAGVFAGAVAYLVARRGAPREEDVEREHEPGDVASTS
ncbi:MAG: prolipoprotein diacylglyceryl transferase [Actinomycetota bacterium]|nr:prolipoprotein diacylglyceryl transferase [Actinomycetota bacterium]